MPDRDRLVYQAGFDAERVFRSESQPLTVLDKPAELLPQAQDVLICLELKIDAGSSCNAKVILLADHGKLTSSAAVRLGWFDQINAAITDKKPPESVIAALKDAGTELIIAP